MPRRASSLNPIKEDDQLSEVASGVGDPLMVPPKITPRFVDEAVEAVLREMELGPDASHVMRELISKDENSGVAYHYYHSRAKQALDDTFARVRKQELSIGYVLTDQETSDLVSYAPEFDIVFRNTANHDHAMAAASRIIDHRLILSRLPTGMSMTDVGGNPLFHIRQGVGNRHLCNPDADRKDPQRVTLRRLEARKLGNSLEETPEVRELARRFIDGDPTFACGKKAQDCDHASVVISAIHVYDVPMQDWPLIMEKKGARVVEGCMLFSPRFFEQAVGELHVAGARYEVLPDKDLIRMGFVGSPSWWYEHSWSQYMRYGVDQVLYTPNGVYSYKVVERRGDTLFFRILRVQKGARPQMDQYYELPDVDVVEVKGFELQSYQKSARSLTPRTYRFPRPLWYDMVNHAQLEFERGKLNFGDLVNYYRTVAPRQTINATLIMGGFTVDLSEVVPLVVHAGLAAAHAVHLSQRTVRGITEVEMQQRLLQGENVLYKVFDAFWGSLVSFVKIPLIPFSLIGSLLQVAHKAVLSVKVLAWAPVSRIVRVNVIHMLVSTVAERHRFRATGELVEGHAYESHVAENAPFDLILAAAKEPEMANMMLDLCRDFMPPRQIQALEVAAHRLAVKPVSLVSAPPTYRTELSGSVTEVVRDDSLHVERLLAIQEAIEEAEMENRKLVESCARAHTALTRRGQPVKAHLKKYDELYCYPDFWEVRNGVIQKSVLGLEASDFRHSAVYGPRADPSTGSQIMAVFDQQWEGEDNEGRFVVREYKMVSDKEFSGWVMTTDLLVIYNGPEIIRTLREALNVRHDYRVVLEEGPPGCGKTSAIVAAVGPQDCVMCPVRESIQDTRMRILQRLPNFVDPKLWLRTVDSYLKNYFLDGKTESMQSEVLRADEAFMTHSGKWYACAGLLGVTVVYAYGDTKQIPHIPRVQAAKLYVRLSAQEVKFNWFTHRCPADAVAAWGFLYDDKVRTTTKVRQSMQWVVSAKGLDIPKGCVMMCMYQADKKVLRDMYAQSIGSKSLKIVTAHEAEGKTYEHVWLHRFDTRKRTDDFSLFDKPEHVLVAMSRHTKTFKYVCPADVGDLVNKWIASVNPRKLQAVVDVATAGKSY